MGMLLRRHQAAREAKEAAERARIQAENEASAAVAREQQAEAKVHTAAKPALDAGAAGKRDEQTTTHKRR